MENINREIETINVNGFLKKKKRVTTATISARKKKKHQQPTTLSYNVKITKKINVHWYKRIGEYTPPPHVCMCVCARSRDVSGSGQK